MNGYFDEINGNQYLTLVPTNESKYKTKIKAKIKQKSMKNSGLKSEI